MAVFILFLRGINVGGAKTIRMDALKAVHEALGFTEVQTHLNSGNVVFSAKDAEPGALAKAIEAAVHKAVGFRPAVMVRPLAHLKRVVAKNPFPEMAKSDPSHLLVMLLAEKPDKDARVRIAKAHAGPEEVRLDGATAYLTYPNGIGRSKLTNAVLEKQLGVAGTARNWNTVLKLTEIAEAIAAA